MSRDSTRSTAWARRGVRVLDRLGTRGRTLGSWLDIVAAAGPGYVVRRARAPWGAALSQDTRNRMYAGIWRAAAERVGAETDDLGGGFLEVRRDGARTRIFQQVVALDDPVTLRLALDKTVVHRMLTAAGIPVPEHVVVGLEDLPAAERFVTRHGPCVIKPASGTGGGDGTTTNVRTGAQVLRARLHATRRGDRVLVEEQVDGTVYRLLFLDGELLDVIRHDRPRLTGDGRATVEELVAAENQRRADAGGAVGLACLEIGLDALLTLERQGLSIGSVVEAGCEFDVSTVTNDNRIEDSQTVRSGVSDEVVDTARAAAGAVGLRLAGVDVIAPSIAVPLESSGGVVAEVNGSPGIHHHYLVADRAQATDVAVPILQALLPA